MDMSVIRSEEAFASETQTHAASTRGTAETACGLTREAATRTVSNGLQRMTQAEVPDALREETAILDAMDDGEMSAGGRPARRATLHRRLRPWELPSRSLTKAGLTQALLPIAV